MRIRGTGTLGTYRIASPEHSRRAHVLLVLALLAFAGLAGAGAQETETQQEDMRRSVQISLPPVIYHGDPSTPAPTLSVSYHSEGLNHAKHELVILVGGEDADPAPVRTKHAHGTVELQLPSDWDPESSVVVAVVRSLDSGAILARAERAVTTEPAAIRGRVIAANGDGAPEVRILACSDYVCIPGVSEPTGEFTLEGIPAGSYSLRVGTVSGRRVAGITLSSGEVHEIAEPIVVSDEGNER